MEAHPRESPIEINPNPSPSSSSPNSATSSSTHSSTHSLPTPATPKPTTPRPPPADPTTTHNHPFPTTFIQADTSSFKQVVQLLTGSTETQAKCSATPPKPTPNSKPAAASAAPTPGGPKKPAFKLYERRSSLKGLKTISPLLPGRGPATSASFSPRKLQPPEILSPSILDMPSLVLSPVTPLIPDPFNRPSSGSAHLVQSAEDQAIAEKGFYLHPSPRLAGPGEAPPPRLLPLFPVTSPRAAAAAGSSSAFP